jgi:thioredoxin-related protein
MTATLRPKFLIFLVLCLIGASAVGWGADEDDLELLSFDDTPLAQPLKHPDWFKRSLLDLRDDLADAVKAGRQGIILYFGQQRCAYCRMLLRVNFGRSDIVEYTKRHFDVIPIDIWGVQEVNDLQGNTLTERALALREHTNFTPSLVFYDTQGKVALRLRGYYPPYQFRAALEYVADGYYRQESFPDYLARGEDAPKLDLSALNEEPFFSPPPFNLDRSRFPSARPLVVFFEQGDCHACDVLHGDPLRDPDLAHAFADLDDVQLGLWADTPVVTPAGRHTTAKLWAKELGLFYTPSLLFFNEHGREILRVDSVVRFYRLRHVLAYIQSGAYSKGQSYQSWRAEHPR